jgi:hypothetical protein
MGHSSVLDLIMAIVDLYYLWKERNKKPLPKIVGSVPYVPLRNQKLRSPGQGKA